MRMADPDVAGNPREYQRVAKSVADLSPVVDAYAAYKLALVQLQDARALAADAAGDREARRPLSFPSRRPLSPRPYLPLPISRLFCSCTRWRRWRQRRRGSWKPRLKIWNPS